MVNTLVADFIGLYCWHENRYINKIEHSDIEKNVDIVKKKPKKTLFNNKAVLIVIFDLILQ